LSNDDESLHKHIQSSLDDFIEGLKELKLLLDKPKKTEPTLPYVINGVATTPLGFAESNVVESPGHTDPCKFCQRPIIFFRVKCNMTTKFPRGVRYHLTDPDGRKHLCPNDPTNWDN